MNTAMHGSCRRNSAASRRVQVAVLLATALTACGPGSPPAEFRPQAVSKPNTCPDVAGTYSPGSTAWLEEFAPVKLSGLTGEPVAVLEASPGSAIMSLRLRSDRATFLSHARQMAITTPAAYLEWRSAILAGTSASPAGGRTVDLAALKAAAERLGPLFEVRVPLSHLQCSDGWALLGYRDVHPGSETRGSAHDKPREVELWISRSAAGELLFRRVTYNVVHYTIWAPSSQSLRTSSHSEYSKWQPALQVEAGPLLASELPSLEPPSRDTCRFTPEETQRVLQRIKSALPAGVTLMAGRPNQLHGLPQSNGVCSPTPFGLELDVAEASSLPAIRAALQSVPGLSSVEPLQPSQQRAGRYLARLQARAESN